MTDHLTVVSHPLVQHKLTLMRDQDTSTAVFRQLLREISQLLAYEVTREMPMTTKVIDTPLCEMEAPTLAGKKMALISILRSFVLARDDCGEEIVEAKLLIAAPVELSVQLRCVGDIADEPIDPPHVMLNDIKKPRAGLIGFCERERLHGAAQRGEGIL